MTDSVSMNLGNPANVSQTTIHEIFEIEAITHTGFAFEQFNPQFGAAYRFAYFSACATMSRPIWGMTSIFKCWPAPRVCRYLTFPANLKSRKA